MCSDWESNQQLFGLQASAKSTEPHQAQQDSCVLMGATRARLADNGKDRWVGVGKGGEGYREVGDDQ